MNTRSILAVVAVASIATGVALVETAPPVEAAAACNVSVSQAWKPYRTDAFSNGPSCELAVVTIVVRGADGKVLWTDSSAAEHLMIFAGIKTTKEMTAALKDWQTQNPNRKSTASLPAWKKGEDAPAAGEFPFHPDVDQETYERIRSEKQSLFCYVQGMESESCVAIAKDGAVEKVGVQQFPG